MVTTHVRTEELDERALQTLVEVILAVAYGDEKLGLAEQHVVRGYLARLGDDRLDEGQIEALLVAASLELERAGVDARLAAAAEVLGDDRTKKMVLRLACHAASADGLEPREDAVLRKTARVFGLDPALVDALPE